MNTIPHKIGLAIHQAMIGSCGSIISPAALVKPNLDLSRNSVKKLVFSSLMDDGIDRGARADSPAKQGFIYGSFR